MYKQVVIARKDLGMSPGKLAAQVAHGSTAFLTHIIRNNTTKIHDNQYPAFSIDHKTMERVPQYFRRPDFNQWAQEARDKGEIVFYAKPVNPKERYGEYELCDPSYHYNSSFIIDNGLYEKWIDSEFTKVVLQARNKNHLLKAKTMAEELGMKEEGDFFLIRDNCHTELEPEEDGRTLTCIGFKPMDSEIIDKIGSKYHLYQ